jgi:glycosyltransferase involved in cell wall biosynthesis
VSKVSVIIPTYNRLGFVTEAVASVLAQTRPPAEVIVVDDGSTDGTGAALAASFGGSVRVIHQENAGPSAARNQGIRAAGGEILAFLDSDDLWLPDKLRLQEEFFEEHPDVDLVFGHLQVDSDGANGGGLEISDAADQAFLSRAPGAIANFFEFLVRRDITLTSTLAVRRAALLEVGFFDQRWRLCEDLHLWLRAAVHHEFGFLDVILCRRRKHGGNLVNNWHRREIAHTEVLEDLLVTLAPLPEPRARAIRERLSAICYDLGSSYIRHGAFSIAKDYLGRCTGNVRWDPRWMAKYAAVQVAMIFGKTEPVVKRED